jgi:hypothetical protein
MNRGGQSRSMSVLESAINIVVGYGINVIANATVLPLFGFNPSLHDTLMIGLVFTVISLVRSYALRRAFNWIGIHGISAHRQYRRPLS